MTVSELAARSGRSVEDLVAWAMGGQSGTNAKETSGSSRPRRVNHASGRKVDTRTIDGRASYDQAVLGAIRAAGGEVDAPAVRARVGGTPMQFRASVTRLIEAGEVGYKGKARATRYFIK